MTGNNGNGMPAPAVFREAALAYLGRNWHPIPVAAPVRGNGDTGKNPVLKAWQDHLTRPEEVERFWPDNARRNLGISCGPSRIVVLDFDEAAAFLVWTARHPEAAFTRTVARDNAEPGRCHVYFALGEEQDAPAQLAKVEVGWGDLKSDGGQVVAPPSVHYSGGRYVVVNDAPPLPWRDDYIPEVYLPGIPVEKTKLPGEPPTIAKTVDAGADDGARNQAAFDLARRLRDSGYPEADALSLLEKFAANCRPPLPVAEAHTCWASAEKATHPAAVGTWPTPEPISALGEAPPAWPWESFPVPLRDMGRAIEETMNVPGELAGLATLGAASIACRNVARVEIKPGHLQFPNVFCMAAVPVTVGKTPVAREVQRPLLDYQKAEGEAYAAALSKWAADAKVARAKIAGIERTISRGADNADELTAELVRLQSVEAAKPTPPVIVVNDCTPEAMCRLMHGTGGRLGVFTAEGRQVLAIARGRYSNQGNDIQLFLAGHGGDYLRYDRQSADKPPFEIHHPTLAAFVATQPDSLRTLGASAELRESGFLARWLYVVPEAAGACEYPVASIPPEISQRYGGAITNLLRMPHAVDADGKPAPHVVPMRPAAFRRWREIHDALKAQAATAPPLLAQCLGKMPEHVARIALVFHLVEAADVGVSPGSLTAEEIERAHTLAGVLIAHISRAVALMGETTERSRARELWPILDAARGKLRELRAAEGLGAIEAVKPRDVARNGWAGIDSTDDARAALEALDTKGWLRAATVARVRAAPAHELFFLYPISAGRPGGTQESEDEK